MGTKITSQLYKIVAKLSSSFKDGARWDKRPGAILMEPTSTSIKCTYAHEDFLTQFEIQRDFELDGSSYVSLKEFHEGTFEESPPKDVEKHRERMGLWEAAREAFEDPRYYSEDLIVSPEELITALTIAPIIKSSHKHHVTTVYGKDQYTGLGVRCNQSVTTDGVALVSMDTLLYPTEPFTIPDYLHKFLVTNTPVSICVVKVSKVKYVMISGVEGLGRGANEDWFILYTSKEYPDIEKLLPCKWDTEIDTESLKSFISQNITHIYKAVEKEKYTTCICNIRIPPNSECYEIQLIALNSSNEPINIINEVLYGVKVSSTETTTCFIQLDLFRFSRLLEFSAPFVTMQFSWSDRVKTPISIGDSSTPNFSLLMPMNANQNHWIEVER